MYQLAIASLRGSFDQRFDLSRSRRYAPIALLLFQLFFFRRIFSKIAMQTILIVLSCWLLLNAF
ncbi:hypothetical protein GWG65_39275 [Bradyrhizobium sp. CSA207]|uniref:hypothetical protein n=1 Tax=Bradyrhizobium sp. CSA207 TaxID=2698826 RepID=UPI0023AFC1DF|nr:hypothetical protein [Bradyrhizobium sp. CSA207]MDE5447247.1 hypothetical protein [Bradyrhizobium sp. CSA207]